MRRQTEQGSHQSRFAGAVATEQGHCLARSNAEADTAEHGQAAELDREVLGRQHGLVGGHRQPFAVRSAVRLDVMTER